MAKERGAARKERRAGKAEKPAAVEGAERSRSDIARDRNLPSNERFKAALELAHERLEQGGADVDAGDAKLRAQPLTGPEDAARQEIVASKDMAVDAAKQEVRAQSVVAPDDEQRAAAFTHSPAETRWTSNPDDKPIDLIADLQRMEQDKIAAEEGRAPEPEITVDIELPDETEPKEPKPDRSIAYNLISPDVANPNLPDEIIDPSATSADVVSKFNVEGAKADMNEARSGVDAARKALGKFEGLGTVRLATAAGRAERAQLQETLDAAQKEFEKARAEYVAADSMRMMELRLEETKQAAEKAALEKGMLSGAFDRAHEWYARSGNLNMEAAVKNVFGYVPQNSILRGAMRFASVRTVVSGGLLGLGLYAGAGAAVGVAAIGTRRVLAGIGGAAGSYDLMRRASDKRMDKFRATPTELEKMEDADILEKLEQLEARAMLGGRKLEGNPMYELLRNETAKRLDAVLATADNEQEKQALMELFMSERDAGVVTAKSAMTKEKGRHKILAATVGGLIGSGALAEAYHNLSEQYFNAAPEAATGVDQAESGQIAAGAEQNAAQAAVATEAAPNANAAPPSETGMPVEEPAVETVAAGADPTTIQRGDGFVKIFARQMEVNPAKYGYDAAKDGADVHRWAMKAGNRIARENGLFGKGFGFDAENPGHVTLNADGTYEVTGAREITRASRAAVEVSADSAADAAEPVQTDTLSRVETYVDRDGTPYLRHDWKQFNFDPDMPVESHEAAATLVDAHGKEIQAMTRLMDEARAEYGREDWFNKFDQSMQKVISKESVQWRHEMRIAAGVDAGKLPLDSLSAKGLVDPKKAAQAVFESVRRAGGFPGMDVGTIKALSMERTIAKAMDALTSLDAAPPAAAK